MAQFVVYRHGWNEDNQSQSAGLPEKMPVARIDARSADEACRLALTQVTVHPNQHLSAELAAAVDVQETKLNLKGIALKEEPTVPGQ
jgi:hypothetical protein